MRLLFFLFVVFICHGCAIQDVELIGFGNYNITKTSDNQTRLKLTAELNNPNNFSIKVKKTKLFLNISGNDAGEIKLENTIRIEKNTQKEYEVILTGDQQKIISAITSAGIGIALSGKVTMGIKGWIKGKAFGLSQKVSIDEKKTISLKDLGLNQ